MTRWGRSAPLAATPATGPAFARLLDVAFADSADDVARVLAGGRC